LACFCGIICFILECIYLPRSLHLDHDLKNEKSKHIEDLDRALLSRNVGTNIEELHTPTSTPKKSKGNDGNRKKKLELHKVLYKNKAWRKIDIVF
jgi:hypothetical protein